jgi:hypothetical protein
MSPSWSENRLRSLFVDRVVPFLPETGRAALRTVCGAWRAWLNEAAADPALRAPTAEETEAVVRHLRGLRLPWSGVTERYVRQTLPTVPCLLADAPGEAAELTALVEYLYQRARVSISVYRAPCISPLLMVSGTH